MKTLEVRRHSQTKTSDERGRGSHLSSEGVALARRVGAETGPFERVVVSPVARTMETALAMGFAVDDVVDFAIGKEFWDEIAEHEHWTAPDAFAGYREAIATGGLVAKVARMQRDAWTAALERLSEGDAALFVSHGHAIETGLVACLGDEKLDATGDTFGHCEGFRCRYDDGAFHDFEILRAVE